VSVLVTLTAWELRLARAAGRERHAAAGDRQRAAAYGAAADPDAARDGLGCAGELAVAAWLDRYWTGTPGGLDRDRGDVAGYHVRTRPAADYDLPLHPEDPDRGVFLLVVGPLPTMRIVGWLYGGRGKRREWWHDRYQAGRPAYWVPQTALRPLRTLPAPGRRTLGRAVG
jgi:hypothetical protein